MTNNKKWDLLSLYKTGKTVWSIEDLAIFWRSSNRDLVKAAANYYVRTGKIVSLQRGLYALLRDYNIYELAVKIFTPAYISFETVLRNEGVIFQHYDKIFAASLESRNRVVDDKKIVFRKIKKEVIYNKSGLIDKKFYMIASKERALLDLMYLRSRVYFDNLRSIDWEKVFDLVKIYKNQNLEVRVKKLYEDFIKNNK